MSTSSASSFSSSPSSSDLTSKSSSLQDIPDSVFDYLLALPSHSLVRLCDSKAVVKALFRSLPVLAQTYVNRLLFLESPVSFADAAAVPVEQLSSCGFEPLPPGTAVTSSSRLFRKHRGSSRAKIVHSFHTDGSLLGNASSSSHSQVKDSLEFLDDETSPGYCGRLLLRYGILELDNSPNMTSQTMIDVRSKSIESFGTETRSLSLSANKSDPTSHSGSKTAIDDTLLEQIDLNDSYVKLHPSFQKSYVSVLSLGVGNSIPLLSEKKGPPSIEDLDSFAQNTWQDVLQRLAADEDRESSFIDDLLLKSHLVAKVDGKVDITSSGFQFLLRDTRDQVWILIYNFLQHLHDIQVTREDALRLLFELSYLELGCGYDPTKLGDSDRRLLARLVAMGLIYWRKANRPFYPTRLILSLFNVTGVFQGFSRGQIVCESTFHVYAYTNSPLQVYLLSQFVKIEYQLPNLVVGKIERSTVMHALNNGITGDQMVHFLELHAHELTKSRPEGPIPKSVENQIFLWELERKRIEFFPARLITDFRSLDLFQEARVFAEQNGFLVHANIEKIELIIYESAWEAIRTFIQERRQNKPSQ